MEKRKRIILLSAAFLLLVGTVQSIGLYRDSLQALEKEMPRAIGMGEELENLVLDLESRIGSRLDFRIELENDPLELGRIVKLQSPVSIPKTEFEENSMRLTATLITPQRATAIIKFRGKSYALAEGDSLNGGVVHSIDNRQVIMEKGGKQEVLVNQPAPQNEFTSREPSMEKVEGLEL